MEQDSETTAAATNDVKKDDDAATVSSSSAADDDDGSNYDHGMPLFKYARLVGSLPRLPKSESEPNNSSSNAFSTSCTCSTMGKVVLAPDVLDSNASSDAATLSKRQSDLVWKYPHHVLAMGFKSGQLSVVDARTGVAIVSCRELKEPKVTAVVDVAFDASGTHLAALYANGMCTIWEFKYAAANTTTTTPPVPAMNASTPPPPSPAAVSSPPRRDSNVFTSFLTGFKTPSQNDVTSDSSHHHHHDFNPTRSTIPSLQTTSSQATRVPYPSSFGRPSCMAIDPAYKRSRDKLILVGFKDGRLVMTKRGFLKRRHDYPIYQGSNGPIQAIEWRGHLVAWADESGIKLFDTETSRRIAHVDRPTGARAALYPTISSLRPNLVFETSENLLCAWGDCLMTLSVKERLVRSDNIDHAVEENATSASTTTPETQVVKRRTVQCTMAWELDCIACGVVPLDKDNVAVLGLVPYGNDQDDESEHNASNGSTNDLELHVVSRQEGTVIYADTLPLIEFRNQSGKDAACGFSLLSTYALARMEDSIEAKEEQFHNFDEADDQDIDFQMTLFSSARTEPFKDSHTKWSLRQLQFEEDVIVDKSHVEEPNENGASDDEKEQEDINDSASVDSDDYSFVLRPPETVADENVPSPSAFPPLMVIVSPSDAVLARSREVDDAVSYALSAKKYGLALRRALTYKRQLREYDINELIDEYLRALLRMNESDDKGDGTSLSIRRLHLAAKAMPMLLGGNVRMWERWITAFGKIPGGLFVLREHLPVRDPLLPPGVYEAVLQTMVSEIEHVLSSQDDEPAGGDDEDHVLPQMIGHFLSTLVAWGPTRSLREKIQLHKFVDDNRNPAHGSTNVLDQAVLRDAEKSLERRLHQTSSGYLQLPTSQQAEPAASPNATSPAADDTTDSLFSVDTVLSNIFAHVPLFADDSKFVEETDLSNNRPSLEALAELYMMKGKYKMALRCFLAIGCLHVSPDVLSVEDAAIRSVNGGGRRRSASSNGQYGFVLAMIEYHHLHQCLLDDTFLASMKGGERNEPPIPLVALIQLVGLKDASDFLVEHCVPPPVTRPSLPLSPQPRSSLSEIVADEKQNGDESLPINLVTDQLRPYPKLFHWYLHQILTRKPEMYVKFPRTAIPPRSVTELHRAHLELYIEYTDKRDSAKALSGIETYNLERMSTPLLSFLKAALPIGGIRSDEARRLLEVERTGNKQGLQSNVIVQYPHHFAIELAYVIEHFGKKIEEDANQILDLYLNGAKSLMLAVSYAQRNIEYSSQLWKILIDHCLNNSQDGGDKKDGSLFGSLLECAALSGADLAHLVTQIPQGMNVEGLRPRLVAAVADYRWKLKMHEAASNIGTNERVVLLRELAHRSRRGTRFSRELMEGESSGVGASDGAETGEAKAEEAAVENVAYRPMERPNRYSLSFAVPIR